MAKTFAEHLLHSESSVFEPFVFLDLVPFLVFTRFDGSLSREHPHTCILFYDKHFCIEI